MRNFEIYDNNITIVKFNCYKWNIIPFVSLFCITIVSFWDKMCQSLLKYSTSTMILGARERSHNCQGLIVIIVMSTKMQIVDLIVLLGNYEI